MILAAGRGERMRPLTDERPKSLLVAGGKPLIAWLIERLVTAGIRELVINHAYKGRMIEDEVGDGSKWGASVVYSPEAMALETAGGIARALPLLGGEPFVAVAADIFSDYDFNRLVARASELELAHLVLVDNPPHNARGDFALEGDRMRNSGPESLTFSAIGLYRPALFAGVSPDVPSKLAPLLRAAVDAGHATGEHHRGDWRDIGTPGRLAELDRRLRPAPGASR